MKNWIPNIRIFKITAHTFTLYQKVGWRIKRKSKKETIREKKKLFPLMQCFPKTMMKCVHKITRSEWYKFQNIFKDEVNGILVVLSIMRTRA